MTSGRLSPSGKPLYATFSLCSPIRCCAGDMLGYQTTISRGFRPTAAGSSLPNPTDCECAVPEAIHQASTAGRSARRIASDKPVIPRAARMQPLPVGQAAPSAKARRTPGRSTILRR